MASNPITTSQALTAVGLSASFFYSGFSFCASALVVPLLYPLPARHSASFFDGFFHDGAALVVPISLLATSSLAAGAYFASKDRPTAAAPAATFAGYNVVHLGVAGALVVISALPWTQLYMMPTINKLLAFSNDAAAADKNGPHILDLLKAWRWMNFVRAVFGLGGGLLGLAAFFGQR